MNGYEIFKALIGLNLDYEGFDWLENRGLSEFELLASVVLAQNTNWNNVLKALENLKKSEISSLEALCVLDGEKLALLIKPSGFYNTKAKRLKALCEEILKEFQSLENFKQNVSREWLLHIKGLGCESVDSILNYLCKREILVVDNYTQRLARALDREFESYEDLQEFFQSEVKNKQENLCKMLGKDYELYELYQIFHAQIVAFAKLHLRKNALNSQCKVFFSFC